MSPEPQVAEIIFFGVAAGFLACIVVELACGRGGWLERAAIGLAFAVVNVLLYLALVNITINLMVATGPATTSSGPGPVYVAILAAWVLPAARLWWLRRGAAKP